MLTPMLEKPETKMVRAAISGRAQAGGCDLMQPMWGLGFTPKVIWAIVKVNAKNSGPPAVAPHDLRRTCARLCRQAGGELEQIQFLFGHISVQTTERNLGCKQRFQNAVDDHIGLEPDVPTASGNRIGTAAWM